MRDIILIIVCAISWALTVLRLRVIWASKQSRGSQQKNISFHWLGMFACFSITLTFMISPIAALLDAYTLPNTSILITHYGFLASQYFGVMNLCTALGIPTNQNIIRRLRLSLVIEYAILIALYSTMLVHAPDNISELPESMPIVIFKLFSYPFGIVLCIFVMRTILKYLPSKNAAMMRLRALLIFFSMLAVGLYIFTRLVIYLGYLFPFLNAPILLTASDILLLCATILFLAALLSNRIYARFMIFSKTLDAWHTFQDLHYLAQTLLIYCPLVGGVPLTYPKFWLFIFNSDYYIYRTIIAIMDSKITLAGALQTETSPLPENQLPQAFSLHKALQAANPSNDFADIVETYRHISRGLFARQNSVS